MAAKSNAREIYDFKEHKCAVHEFDGRIITGKINTGSMRRLSDMFTGSQSPFVVIYDATTDNDPRNRTFILNKAGIAWVEPKDSFEVEDRQT
jgi:hypothetical protein